MDPDGGVVQRFAAGLRELRRRAGNPGYRELARLAHYSPTTLAQAARGETLPTLAVTLAYVRACGGDPADWEARWRAATTELEADAAPNGDDPPAAGGPAPYVGLAAYGVEDADRFFGRERLVARLTERLSRQRFVAAIGASGSGKSSLLRAGLLAAVHAEGGHWSTLLITPGAHPLAECATRLGAELHVAPGQLVAELAEQPRNLGLAARQLLAVRSRGGELLLVVDQFEEVFTLCGDARERDTFIAALLAAAGDEDNRTRVVLGLRADFFTHCARHPQLVEALQDTQVLVGPMTPEELREAITRPAVASGLMVEKALITAILEDAAGRQGALPLVSHALWETWRRRRGLGLRLADYRAAGGLGGAIAQSAELVCGELTAAQRRTARDIMLRLTALGDGTEDTRRRVARSELGEDPATVEVLGRLTAARLITMGERTVEIAHEALIAGWPTLREWLAADREALRAHRRLTDTATEWDGAGRDDAYLYRGALLATWQDREQTSLNDTERAFLAASVAGRDRELASRRRRVRLTLVGLGVTVIVVSLLAVLALIQAGGAADERDIALSRQLAANARGQLQFDPEVALLLAIRAVEIRLTVEADSVLRQAIVDSRVRAAVPTGHGRALGVAFSPDGERLATTGDDGTVKVWRQPEPGRPWAEPVVLRGHDGEAWSPVFSPDGRYLATGGADSTVRVWDIRGGGEPVVLSGHRGPVFNVTFAPDGRHLASSADDGVRIWDRTAAVEPVVLTDHDGPAYGVAFSPDGRYLATSGHRDGTVRIVDRTGARDPVVLHGERASQGHLAFSPDSRRLISTSAEGGLRVWDPTGQREPVVLRGHQGTVLSMSLAPDGSTVVSGGQDGTIRVLNANSDTNAVVLRGHRGEVWGVALHPDGRSVASVGTDGALRLWSAVAAGDPTVLRGHDGPAWVARFAADGSRIVSGGKDYTVRVWSIDGTERAVLRGHTDEIMDVAASADGLRVASASLDGTVRMWSSGGEPAVLTDGDGTAWSIGFDQDARRLVVSADDVRVVPVTGGGDPMVLHRGKGTVRQVAISADGRRVAGAGSDGAVWIWSATGDTEPLSLRGHQGQVFSVAFSPDGQRIASGGHDGTVRIWTATGEGEPVVLPGHQGLVWSLAFSADGRHLASSGNDGTLRVWPATGVGEPVVYRGYQASVESVAFAPDGARLLTTHDDGTVRIQRCDVCGDLDDVLALARSRVSRALTADERKAFGVGP